MTLTLAAYAAMAVCLAGVAWRVGGWFRAPIGPEARNDPPGERIVAACKAVLRSVFRPHLFFVVLRHVIFDLLLQRRLLTGGRRRWLVHMALSYGIVLLVLLHVFDESITAGLFDGYESTLNPYQAMRHILGAAALAGIAAALFRRRRMAGASGSHGGADLAILGLLAGILLSGICLEAVKIVSPTLFDQMVVDYWGSDDPEEIAPLKALWAAEFAVGFAPPPAADPDTLRAGRALHQDYCAACHSRPNSAILSYPLALGLKPLAGALDHLRIEKWLRHLHILLACLALALLPFSALFHIVSTPLSLALRGIGRAAHNLPVNRATRRALGLDACTHCGICNRQCSVAPIALALGNPAVLPSEKLAAVAEKRAGRMDDRLRGRLVEASHVCTGCGRCTACCPAGIDLQDLWQASREDLIRDGYPEPHAWVRRRNAAQWAWNLSPARAADDPHGTPATPFQRLTDDPDTFWACVQCTTCTSVCPVVAVSDDPRRDLDLTPQQIMNLIRLRLKDMALGSRMVWDCVTCYKCQEHCPQGIRVADVLYELRNEACRRFSPPPAAGRVTDAALRN